MVSTIVQRVRHDGLGGRDVLDSSGNLFAVAAYGWAVEVAFHRLPHVLVHCWAAA